jgi:ribosomal protein S18 acetylase RimI-like enzyme
VPQIRQANESDIPAIVAVVNAAFEVEKDFRGGDRTSVAEISQLMQSSTFLVATHGVAIEAEQVVGAVLVRVNGTRGYFGMLAAQPGMQRSGIGRALLEAAEDYCRARGCTEMTLSTGSVRRELLDLYAKLGYRVTSVEPAPPDGPFTKPIEIVKMTKSLL